MFKAIHRYNNAQQIYLFIRSLTYSRIEKGRNECVNVVYFTPIETARIITADRDGMRKLFAAV